MLVSRESARCFLVIADGVAVHLLLGNPQSANNLMGIVGGVALACTLLLPLYLIASVAAAFLHWQQRPAQHAT